MIIYFSGTGNSRAVAQGLSEALGDSSVTAITSPSGECRLSTADSGEKVIWVFPIYSWGVPPIVKKYIRSIGASSLDSAEHFMVCTCGDDCGFAHKQWRREMKRKGWTARGAWSVIMPNTYVALPGFDVDPTDLAQDKIAKATRRIKEVARAISVSSRVEDITIGSMPWLKTRIIYPFFTRFLMSAKRFRVSEACIGCARCAQACPTGNIVINEKPVWRDNCAGCQACYHSCPYHAINRSKFTESKGQYRYAQTTNPSIRNQKQ